MTVAAVMDGPAVLDRVASRYRACRRFTRHYVASKVRRDPMHLAILRLAAARPFGAVVDIGCGRGQVGIALLEAGAAAQVLGLDWAGASLDDARRAGAGLAFTAREQDLAQDPGIPDCDTALLLDVLYTLGRDRALRLLAATAASARRRIVIRTLDPARGARSALTIGLERLFRAVWPHSGAVTDPVPIPMLTALLEGAGFLVEIVPCWEGTPFANVLLVAERA